MKQKLTAGAELDLLTKPELVDALKSWQQEMARGAKLLRRSFSGVVAADGSIAMGDNRDGPAEGMAWAVTRVSLGTGVTIPTAGMQMYANDANPSSLLLRNIGTADVFPGDHGCNLMAGDSIRFAGAGFTTGETVTVTISVKEVPMAQIWSL